MHHANGKPSAPKARGRPAHEGHLSKVGTAWKEDFVQVIVRDPVTKAHKLLKMPRGNISCKKCHEIIRYDTRGYAYCQCQIYNDGNAKPRHSYLDRDFLKSLKFKSAIPGVV